VSNDPSQTPSRVRETADLARLGLTDEECARLEPELDAILDHFKALSELELEGVEGTATVGLQDVTRPDEPRPSMDPAPLLERAPREKDGHYQVPRAVGGTE
jgi:aspartyl-tRNA(Asn)/glutamyl-tRNA(Gln) amidotransferase subunit C